jgi:type IV pilus assembly protein PilM
MPSPMLQSDAVGRSAVCPACQRENSLGRRFCGNCGHALWEGCPQCNGEVAVHERFCGQCGLDTRQLAADQERQLQERLDAAAALAGEHRYEAALSALRGIAAVKDPKLESWATAALARIQEVQSRQQIARAEAASAKEEAKRHVQEQAFERAVKLVESIPPPLRDAEATELLTHARFAGKELAALLADIRGAAQEGRTWELFPKINRVLALKPEHQAVRKLADQLRQKFIATARKRLADERYEDAVQAMLQVPLSLRTDEVSEILDTASEMAALLSDLKQSTYATAEALALAQRLTRHSPANKEVARLSRQLAERCASQPSSPRWAMPQWANPPERRASAPCIEWLGHFVRTRSGPQVTETMREHPGQFFVALGLALQGLGKAAIDVSLLPSDKRNVLSKLAAIPLLGRRVISAWGIDLGGYALKAIKLTKDGGGNVQVDEAHYILLSKPLAHPDAEGQRPAILAEALSDLAHCVELNGSAVVGGLSGHHVLGRFFDLPPLPRKKVASAVEYEARHQIPIELAELCWDWTELGEIDPKQTGKIPQSIMVVAARQSHVQDRLALFASAGIRLDSLQSDCLALHNALRYELEGEPAVGTGPIAVVDVGADETNFVVSSPTSIWFRTFGLAGHSFTTALLQQFQLTFERAEDLKRHPAKARRYYQFRETLQPLSVQFADEIDRSLCSFRRHSPAANIERLLAIGGGANLHGLLGHCAKAIAT